MILIKSLALFLQILILLLIEIIIIIIIQIILILLLLIIIIIIIIIYNNIQRNYPFCVHISKYQFYLLNIIIY